MRKCSVAPTSSASASISRCASSVARYARAPPRGAGAMRGGGGGGAGAPPPRGAAPALGPGGVYQGGGAGEKDPAVAARGARGAPPPLPPHRTDPVPEQVPRGGEPADAR